jgi:uncharacterized protein (TIGR03089 family)
VTTPAGLLAARLAADPARPFVTFYDDATGERVELSVATFANWVSKTGNLLQDDLGVTAGSRITVRLPAHWQAAVVLVGCWSVGALVAPRAGEPTDDEPADVAFVDEGSLERAPNADEVVALSLAPMGRGLGTPRPGVVDFAAEVLSHGDVFSAYEPPRDDTPLLALEGRTWTAAELAVRHAPPGARVLSVLPYADLAGLRHGLLGPLHDGSVVLCRNPSAEALAARAEAERVTHTAGVDVSGLPRLA